MGEFFHEVVDRFFVDVVDDDGDGGVEKVEVFKKVYAAGEVAGAVDEDEVVVVGGKAGDCFSVIPVFS